MLDLLINFTFKYLICFNFYASVCSHALIYSLDILLDYIIYAIESLYSLPPPDFGVIPSIPRALLTLFYA